MLPWFSVLCMWLTVCLFCVVSWLSDTWHSCWSMQECEPLLVEISGHPCLRECCNVSPFLPMILPFMQVFFYHPGEWWFVKISRNSKFAGTKDWSIIFHFWNVLNKATNPMLWQVGFGHLGLPETIASSSSIIVWPWGIFLCFDLGFVGQAAVVEVSSYQMELPGSFHPKVGATIPTLFKGRISFV